MSAATEFLARLYPKGPYCLSAATPDKDKLDTRTFVDLNQAEDWINAYNGERNLYYHVNPPIDATIRRKLKRTDVKSLNYLHVDIDPRPDEAPDAAFRARALGLLQNYQPPPTIIVFSGSGFQGLWKLREPVLLDGTNETADKYSLYNKFIESKVGGDNCHNIDRLLRLPGTLNIPGAQKIKKGRVQAEAELVSFLDYNCFDITAFEAASASKHQQQPLLAAVENSSPTKTLDLDALNQWSVPQRVKVVIAKGSVPGETKKGDNSRSAWLYDCLCQLIRFSVPDNIILGLILDPEWKISESVVEKTSPEQYARKQLEKAYGKAVKGEHAPSRDAPSAVSGVAVPAAPDASQGSAPSDPTKESWLDQLNAQHAVLTCIGGKTRVLRWDVDEIGFQLQTFTDFENTYCNSLVYLTKVMADGSTKAVPKPVGRWWLDHPERREYVGLVFQPPSRTNPIGRQVINGSLNIWRGWGVVPKPGCWDLLKEHIVNVLADHNIDHAMYIMRWAAWAVQNPDKPAETAIVFKGIPGAGKGFFCRALTQLFGKHGRHICSSDHLTGRFNAHLENCCVLFADEAIAPNEKKAESILKAMITEPELTIERKGIDPIPFKNMLHIMMASNEDWIVPIGKNDRRYAVFNVSSQHAQESVYFERMQKQLDTGGYAAMLDELMLMDLDGWHPRQDLPETLAKQEQRDRSTRGPLRSVLEMLKSADPNGFIKEDSKCVFVGTKQICESLKISVHGQQELYQALMAIGGRRSREASPREGKVAGFWLPPLKMARQLWNTWQKETRNWDHPDAEWLGTDKEKSDYDDLSSQRMLEN